MADKVQVPEITTSVDEERASILEKIKSANEALAVLDKTKAEETEAALNSMRVDVVQEIEMDLLAALPEDVFAKIALVGASGIQIVQAPDANDPEAPAVSTVRLITVAPKKATSTSNGSGGGGSIRRRRLPDGFEGTLAEVVDRVGVPADYVQKMADAEGNNSKLWQLKDQIARNAGAVNV